MGISPVSPSRMDDLVLALDFGGTKLAAAVVDPCRGEIISPVIRQQTPVSEGASGTLSAMIECGRRAVASIDNPKAVKAVGISFGGPVNNDRRSVLVSNHVADWNGYPLADEISKVFKLPAVMENDGNLAALGQWWYGGYRQFENLVYIQISTGIGGGLVLGGKLYRGSGLAAEFGHILVDEDGELCSCGRKGCLESVCSGWAFAREGRDAMINNPDDCPTLIRLCQNKPETITATMLFEACRALDPACVNSVRTGLHKLAITIRNLISSIDPQVVVLGGGVTRSRDMFEKYFFPDLNEHMHPFFMGRSKIELSTLDGSELLLGAALITQTTIY